MLGVGWKNCSEVRPPYELVIIRNIQYRTIFVTHGEAFIHQMRETHPRFLGRLKDYEWVLFSEKLWWDLSLN